MAVYSLEPVTVPQIDTKYRTIKTAIPVPESLPIFAQLEKSEPRSMRGQPPIIWHKADDFTIYDKWGNRWIDWTSCVLVANAGHGAPAVKQALRDIIDQGLLASYVFVHEQRAQLTSLLQTLAPDPDKYTVFLLSTGSEATENCVKLSKTYALEKYGPKRKYFISFVNGFHGRTMGSQLSGGWERQKTWMVDRDQTFIQAPFPDGFKNENTSFDLFLQTLRDHDVKPDEIAGVMTESYQGGGPDFMPVEYAQKLEAFCREHDIVLTFDEVQSGFGRTGKLFCFEHYGVTPDLIPCGKGISSSLPLSAVIGRRDIMDMYTPGSMTSTHSGSPLPVAAALASVKTIQSQGLAEHAAKMEPVLMGELSRIQQKYPQALGCLTGKGLVAGIQVVKPGTKIPDSETALRINLESLYRGVLMFAPVGGAGECLKIAPPLTIPEDALRESIAAFGAAVDAVLG